MSKALRARIELLGGKEVVGTFERIKSAAKSGFDTIEREAKQATRDVRELERELAKLEAEAKSIRANIRVSRSGVLTGEQQQALAFAKQLESQAAAVRQQIDHANATLRQGGGDALRTLAASAGQDLLKVADATDKIDASLADVRGSGGLGGLISDDQLSRLENISKSLSIGNAGYYEGLGSRVQRADDTDAIKALAAQEKAEKAEARAAKQRARRAAEARKEAEELAKAKEEDLRKEGEAVRRALETDRRRKERHSRYLDRLDADAKQAEWNRLAALERYRDAQVHKTALAERREGERLAALARIDMVRRVNADREIARARRSTVPASGPSFLSRDDRTSAVSARRVSDRLPGGLVGVVKDSKQVEIVLSGLGLGFDRLGRGFKAAIGDGKAFNGMLGQVGRTMSATIRDVGNFASALEGVAGALGKVALRSTVATAIVGLVGAIGVALAALGGAAVVAGIGAISALAAINVQGLKNAAAEIGTSVESLTRLNYAGFVLGMKTDDVVSGLSALQEMSMGVVEGSEAAADATRLFKRMGIEVWKPGTNDLRDQVDIVRDLAKAYQSLPTDTLRKAFLKTIGGDSFKDIEKLVPLLTAPIDRIDELMRRSDRSGFTVGEEQLKGLQKLAELFREIWMNIVGTANRLALQIMPSLEPLLNGFNDWLLDNQKEIIDYLIWLFDSVISITKDFIALYRTGGEADVVNQWTKTLYTGVLRVIDVFDQLWQGFKVGWSYAEGPLTRLGAALGTGGPIATALLLLGAWVLGFFGLFKAGGKLGLAGLRIITGFVGGTFIPVIKGALKWISGIVGWPLLLAGMLGLVATHWDKIGSIIEGAWNRFKETFPKTASVLESAFGPAVAATKRFAADFSGELERTLPQTSKFLTELDAALSGIDWSNLYNGLDAEGNVILFVLAQAIESIAFALRYALAAIQEFKTQAANVVGGSRLNPENEANTPARQTGRSVVSSVLGPGLGDVVDYLFGGSVNAFSDAISGTAPAVPENPAKIPAPAIETVPNYRLPGAGMLQMPIPPLANAPANAGQGGQGFEPGGTAFSIQIDTGPIIYATTQQPDAAAQLAAQGRARIVTRGPR